MMKKSTRHNTISGDFGEALVLYWLSKFGYECARIDHTGIDLIACKTDGSERMGISVQCRSRYDGTEKESVNLHPFEDTRKTLQGIWSRSLRRNCSRWCQYHPMLPAFT
jgi:hypothetical protein